MSQIIHKLKPFTNHPLLEIDQGIPEAGLELMRFQKGQSKYMLKEGNVIGLNLSGTGLDDKGWADLQGQIDLTTLRYLNLSDNKLGNFVLPATLQHLVWLNLSDNPALAQCRLPTDMPQLEHLDISGCVLTSFALPAQAARLAWVSLRGNKLEQVACKHSYPALQQLDLCYNQLTIVDLPTSVQHLRYIGFDGNEALAQPPIEIALRGTESIKNWHKAEKKAFKEIKIMILGDAKAGKTSLLRRLKDNTFNPNEPQTDGVLIEPFDFGQLPTFASQKGLHDIKAYLWDFGGQDIMRATHQFFLTKRSAYIVLLEARNDNDPEEQARKWLQQIQREGGNSPVLIVVNKIEVNRSYGLPFNKLQIEFPQLKHWICISCKEGPNGENIDGLRQLLEQHLPEVELLKSDIDEKWIAIKDDLQRETSDVPRLNETRFRQICSNHTLEGTKQQDDAIAFLNDLGILLHFAQLRTKDFFVLDPYWVTYGVYRIVTSPEVAKNKGRVSLGRLPYIVNEEPRDVEQYVSSKQRKEPYSHADTLYLAEIMELFKLCFHTKGEAIILPELLDYEEPRGAFAPFEQAQQALRLVYRYPKGMPPHTFTRFMVECHTQIEHSWRKGMVLRCDTDSSKARALVVRGDDLLKITVIGEHRDKSQYLAVLRDKLETIQKAQNAEAVISVPLPGYLHLEIGLEELLNKERSEELHTDYRLNPPVKFHIRENLLDGIEVPLGSKEKGEGMKEIHHHYHGDPKGGPTPPQVPKKQVMFVISSPVPDDKSLNPLDFGKDLLKINEALRSSEHRDDYEEPIIRPGVQADNFVRTVLAKRPVFLHLSMHASKSKGLYFENAQQQIEPVDVGDLREMFELFHAEEYRPQICVLSACNTLRHAEAILPYCGAVVGTSDFIPDTAASLYADMLYGLLFDGSSIQTAHKQACMALKRRAMDYENDNLQVPIQDIPVLFTH